MSKPSAKKKRKNTERIKRSREKDKRERQQERAKQRREKNLFQSEFINNDDQDSDQSDTEFGGVVPRKPLSTLIPKGKGKDSSLKSPLNIKLLEIDERVKNYQERSVKSESANKAFKKGIELWQALQSNDTTESLQKLDQQFSNHYFNDLDSSEFEGVYKNKPLNDDQYVVSSWGVEQSSSKPPEQGAKESQNEYDERISQLGDAHYTNFFDLGINGTIVATSNFRDKDSNVGAKGNSVPNNISIWGQYMVTLNDWSRRSGNDIASALKNLKSIRRKEISNDETMEVITQFFSEDMIKDKSVTLDPGDDRFFSIIGTPNGKSVVRMLSERKGVLNKDIESVSLFKDGIGISLQFNLKNRV
ncbi:hypothetical protein [Pleionea sediminis]|uniref:hypothetical protein n=1 Tax=Pleionea sediminis TaxID=2569479 RepID=UPI001185173A|nr:hypothetical protein [Pleionea sediminis]